MKRIKCSTISPAAATRDVRCTSSPIPWVRWAPPFAKYGIELTDSIYVVLNMAIMTRVGKDVLEALGDSDDWVRGLHCKCDIVEEKAVYLPLPAGQHHHFGQLRLRRECAAGQKVLALRIASNLGRQEGWMAEHMLILGLGARTAK